MFEAFQLGPFLFHSHHLFLLLGVWLATELFLRILLAEGVRIVHLLRKALVFLASFLLGGRLFGVLLLYRLYVQDPLRLLVVWDGVFSVVGGCIGIGSVLLFMARRQRSPFLHVLDMVVPPMTLLFAFDWVGRLFGALSYGKPTDVPWGVVLESMSVRYTVPIHPVQLYYALWFFALTVLLLMMQKRRRAARSRPGGPSPRHGTTALTGIVLGCTGVILLEFFRGDFAVTVFAKLTDFVFLAFLFASLGAIAIFERRLSRRSSLANSVLIGAGTVTYLLLRPWISVLSIEWRFSQFLAVLAILGTVVYGTARRCSPTGSGPIPAAPPTAVRR